MANGRLQALGVVHAVLQAEHHSALGQVRGQRAARALGVGGFDAKKHPLRAICGAGIGAGGHAHPFSEGLRFKQQAAGVDGRGVVRAGNQGDLVACARQHAAVITAHGTRAHHGNFHGTTFVSSPAGAGGRLSTALPSQPARFRAKAPLCDARAHRMARRGTGHPLCGQMPSGMMMRCPRKISPRGVPGFESFLDAPAHLFSRC